MATITHLCGFEFGAILTVNGGGLWYAIVGSPTVQSTYVLSGAYSLRINPTAAAQYAQYKLLDASTNTLVGQVRFKFRAWPSVKSEIITVDNETLANCRFSLDPADNKIEVSFLGTNPQKSTNAISLDTEYILDFREVLSASPTTLNWSINGVAQTSTSITGTGSIVGGPMLGFVTSASGDLIIDDLILSSTSVDYPLSASRVKGLRPNADGAHNNTTNVYEDAAGNDIDGSSVFAYVQIDDNPWSTTLNDRIQDNLLAQTRYVEVVIPDITETTIVGVRGYLEYASASATGNNGATIVRRSDTTQIAIYGTQAAPADMSETTAFYKSSLITAPGGGWTQSEVNALVIRLGYSSDATPDPWWEAVMLEYAYTVSSGIVGTLTLTLDAFGLSSAGVSTIVGALTKTLDALGLSASGVSTIVGSSAITIDNLGLSAGGVVAVVGSLTKTLDALGLTATGTVTEPGVVGTLTLTLDGFGLNAAGVSTIVGTLTKTIDDLGLVAGGVVSVVGNANITLDIFGLAANGASTIVGSAAINIDPLGLTSSGAVAITGAANIGLDAFGLTASGVSTIIGAFTKTLDDLGLTATGTVTETGGIVGTLILTLDVFGLSASGVSTIVGASNITLGNFGLSASGQSAIVGSAIIAIDPLGLTAVGTVTIIGAANIGLDSFVLSASGTSTIIGTITKTLDNFGLSASGIVGSAESIGTANIILDGFQIIATGAVSVAGIANITLDGITIAATIWIYGGKSTPPYRVMTIEAESRISEIGVEDRTLEVALEDRIFEVVK